MRHKKIWLTNTDLYNNEQISLSLQTRKLHRSYTVQVISTFRAATKLRALAQFHGSSYATSAIRPT
jgi:hypothetical protein